MRHQVQQHARQFILVLIEDRDGTLHIVIWDNDDIIEC